MHHLPATAAIRTGLGAGALLRTGAAAIRTGTDALDIDLLFAALGRLLKGENDRRSRVAAPPGGIGIRPTAAAEATATAEEGGKNIPQISEIHTAAVSSAGAGAEIRIHSGMAVLIVARFFLRVGQHLVGLVDLLEVGFRLFIPRIQVGVILFRHLSIGFFDFILRGALLNPQHLVEIPLICHCSNHSSPCGIVAGFTE